MLKLTKKADYGLIALKDLTVRHPLSASAKDIADRYGVPLPLLSKILQKLAKAGFLRSEQGVNGGYRLARDPESINTFEIIRAIDGPIFLTACFTEHGGCEHSEKCNVRDPLRKVHEGIVNLLSSIKLTDIAQEDQPVVTGPASCMPIVAAEPLTTISTRGN
jgi:FeS assembly SUF system regulator